MSACGVRPSVCLRVCPSVTFVDHVKTNKHIVKIFSHHSSFSIPNGVAIFRRDPPNGGVECRWGRQKTRFWWTYIGLYWTFVFWCLQHINSETLIGVFLDHFRINLHQSRTQYSNEGPQHWNAAQFQKSLSRSGILSPKNSCSHFSSPR